MTVGSSKGRPASCSPIGSPPLVKPQGAEIAGMPVRLYGPVKLNVLEVDHVSISSNRPAGFDMVGEAIRSYRVIASLNSLVNTFLTRWACT